MTRSRRARPAGPGLAERFKRTASLLLSREVTVLNNAIAFNFLLCLFPLLLVLVAAAQRLAPGGGTATALRQLLTELIPVGGDTFASSLRQMTRLAPGFELLSLALIVWGSSGIFIPVERVLNLVWGARAERSFWKSRLLAFLLTAAGAALALVSLALTLFGRSLARVSPLDQQFAAPLALAASWAAKVTAFGLGWALFTLVYRIAPSARIDFGDRRARRALGGAGLGALEVRVRLEPGADAAFDLLRPARVFGGARALGLRLEPRAGLRRGNGAGRAGAARLTSPRA